jgi:4-amino-4-deoxy-L-arabinose transferase-like glycosyltransferase
MANAGRSVHLRWLAVLIILAVTAWRVAYLFFFCPYDLAPDEGHYWDWSRNLDWSYYSKGPLIAWIIRAGCELFGELAVATQGTLMPAVRLPAVLCGSAMLAGLYVLSYQSFRNDRLALGTVLAALSLPAFTACSVVMTIDAPFLCCWMWALVFGRWAMIDGKRWAWPVAGLLIAAGILAKYTMGLWLVSAGLFLLFTPSQRGLLTRPGFWLMVFVAGLSAVPILLWNSQHDWVTFRHVAVQAGVAESKENPGLRWGGPFKYLGGQLVVLLGYWFVCWVGALIRFWPRPAVPAGVRYLWWMSVPTFLVFAASSVRAAGQLNWPVAAYLSGAVLVGAWLSEQLNSSRPLWRRVVRWFFGIAIGLGVAVSILAHDTRIVTRLALPYVPAETPTDPMPLRRFDPTARLKGYRFLASELDQIRRTILDTEGDAPLLAGLRWDVPGLLGFYMEGHPHAYSFGLVLGLDRHSQYDLWHPNPSDDPDAFRGQTFIIVAGGDATAALAPAFASVQRVDDIVYREHGRVLANWFVFVCRGYKGFDPTLRRGSGASH